MTKKEYLLKVLEALEPVWDLAPWLKIIVNQWTFWDDEIDKLIEMVESGIHSAKSEIDKEKMQKWLDALKIMKEMEAKNISKDNERLSQLDDIIDSF